jgi:hypothetical protein
MKTINLKHFTKNIGKVVQENSPTILTALGVVGVAATGYFTHKAATQAQKEINDNKPFDMNNGPAPAPLTTRETVELVWKLYIPAVTTGVMTVGCIIAANRIQVRRMAALAGAYAVISGDFDEYREKAQELLGVKKSAELEEQRLKKQMDKYPSPISALSPGKNEFCEYTSMRYFESTIEDIKHAVNQLNYMINTGDFPCLNDFYDALGLDPTDIGDAFGWGDGTLIDVAFTPVMKDEGRAVTAVRFRTAPRPKFWKSHD